MTNNKEPKSISSEDLLLHESQTTKRMQQMQARIKAAAVRRADALNKFISPDLDADDLRTRTQHAFDYRMADEDHVDLIRQNRREGGKYHHGGKRKKAKEIKEDVQSPARKKELTTKEASLLKSYLKLASRAEAAKINIQKKFGKKAKAVIGAYGAILDVRRQEEASSEVHGVGGKVVKEDLQTVGRHKEHISTIKKALDKKRRSPPSRITDHRKNATNAG